MGKKLEKIQVNIETLKAGDETIAKQQAVHNVHNRTTHP